MEKSGNGVIEISQASGQPVHMVCPGVVHSPLDSEITANIFHTNVLFWDSLHMLQRIERMVAIFEREKYINQWSNSDSLGVWAETNFD